MLGKTQDKAIGQGMFLMKAIVKIQMDIEVKVNELDFDWIRELIKFRAPWLDATGAHVDKGYYSLRSLGNTIEVVKIEKIK